MAPSGQEAILGMNRYPIFGPLLMFGFGGIFVEVFQDVSFRLAPIGRNSARKMIRSIKGYKMFHECSCKEKIKRKEYGQQDWRNKYNVILF